MRAVAGAGHAAMWQYLQRLFETRCTRCCKIVFCLIIGRCKLKRRYSDHWEMHDQQKNAKEVQNSENLCFTQVRMKYNTLFIAFLERSCWACVSSSAAANSKEDTLITEKCAINKIMQKKSRTLRTCAQTHFTQVRTKYNTLFVAFLERSCWAWSLSCDNFFLIVKTERAKNCWTLTRWPLVKSSKTACKNLSGGKICQVASTCLLLSWVSPSSCWMSQCSELCFGSLPPLCMYRTIRGTSPHLPWHGWRGSTYVRHIRWHKNIDQGKEPTTSGPIPGWRMC